MLEYRLMKQGQINISRVIILVLLSVQFRGNKSIPTMQAHRGVTWYSFRLDALMSPICDEEMQELPGLVLSLLFIPLN